LPGPNKLKKAKFGHKQVQKGQILKKEKKTKSIFIEITRFKVRIS